ncbi:MAG: bifunctional glycosyltransferase family 2/GtrA family protein [Lachnospiraceae bacterium]|nr:bifunctional glycosyltransferase family 2/GtrA family protein [Lachnospiraceae bacterium]
MKHDNIYVIIPALDPDAKLIKLLDELHTINITKIVLIDDGTRNEGNKNIFEMALNKYPDLIILRNYINLGKGRALKYAFNYLLNNSGMVKGAVTADSDGQHSASDIQKCINLLRQEPDDSNVLFLGYRDFDSKNVPFRSKFGNKITRIVLSGLCGVNVTDTQTGLRGFTRKSMESFLDTGGERFEYETNMLIETKSKNVKIKEYPIETIYIKEDGGVNKTSHFNPLKDSLKIYSLFIKFIIASFASFIIDITLFAILCKVFADIMPVYVIFVSTYLARAVSAIFNFIMNRHKVFHSNVPIVESAVKYIILCVVQAFLSGCLVTLLVHYLTFNNVVAKIIIDTFLFFINFGIQREYIFKNRGEVV